MHGLKPGAQGGAETDTWSQSAAAYAWEKENRSVYCATSKEVNVLNVKQNLKTWGKKDT